MAATLPAGERTSLMVIDMLMEALCEREFDLMN